MARPKAGTTLVAASGGICAVKSFENSLQVFFFNANTIVGDFHQHMFAICIINTGCNAAILFSVFGSILNQVEQYHPDLFFIGKNQDRIFATFFNAGAHIFILHIDGKGFKNFTDQVLDYKILFKQ